MDFPDCTTNVHKLVSRSFRRTVKAEVGQDGVKAVFWATYAPQDYSHRDENYSPEDVGDQAWNTGDVVHLQKATDYLRSLGQHTFCDSGQLTIWVFGLSRDGKASVESARNRESIWQVTKPLELASGQYPKSQKP